MNGWGGGSVSFGLAIVLGLLEMGRLRQARKFDAIKTKIKRLHAVETLLYKNRWRVSDEETDLPMLLAARVKRKTTDTHGLVFGILYAQAGQLALRREVPDRAARLASRAKRIESSKDALMDELCTKWIRQVGFFAQAARRERLHLRSFLQTYHLSVIREGVTVAPMLLRRLAAGEISDEDRKAAYWGIALLDLAAWYNRMASVQREPVYIMSRPLPIGPVLRGGPHTGWKRLRNDFADMVSTRMPLRLYRYWRAKRFLDDALEKLKGEPRACLIRCLGGRL
jgi:hypothetical protein